MIDHLLRGSRGMLRGIFLVCVIAWGLLLTFALLFVRPFGARVHDRCLQPVARHWFRLMLRALGVRRHVQGEPAPGPVLVAANHISWLDIVVLGAQVGAGFVSKSEVAGWPLLGWLAQQGGTLFIHRGRHDSAERIAHDMTHRLLRGGRLLFFPEGTTSNGTDVKRFRNRLFQPAVQIDAPVQPVALRYARGAEAVDPVAYVQGVSLVASLCGVLARRRTDVHLRWLPPLQPAGQDRRVVAEAAERAVTQAFHALPYS